MKDSTAASERMQGTLLSTHETPLSPEEQIGVEDGLSPYCKPVELYNILQHRAVHNPSFLQRCLQYKVEAKPRNRVEMIISIPPMASDESRNRSLFPLHVYLVEVKNSVVYRCIGKFEFANCTGHDGMYDNRATLVLPDARKLLAEVKSGSLSILFVSLATLFEEHMDASSSANDRGSFLLGKIPLKLHHLSWKKSPNSSSGGRAEILSAVEFRPGFMEIRCLGEDKYFLFQNPDNGDMETPLQLQVSIEAQKIGAYERSPNDSFSNSGIPLMTLSRLTAGIVFFNYQDSYNKLLRTEVTENFTCSFCLVKCASFKGLRLHLSSSHDFFNFEFWVTEEFLAVNVSVKSDIWRSKILATGVDLKRQTFFFCSKTFRSRKQKRVSQESKHVLAVHSELPGSVSGLQEKTDGIAENGGQAVSNPTISFAKDDSCADAEGVQSGSSLQPILVPFGDTGKGKGKLPIGQDASSCWISSATDSFVDPQFEHSLPGSFLPSPIPVPSAKMSKLSIKRSVPRKDDLLQKRQFFHSHGAQMAMEEVMQDRDSEDEVDGDVADIEDRRRLDEFVDVTKDEKMVMHLWNCFVRKQRVVADGHVPWACEAFSNLHGKHLVQNPGLLCCWRLFMVKLWNHGMLDPRRMNNCNIILEKLQNQGTD